MHLTYNHLGVLSTLRNFAYTSTKSEQKLIKYILGEPKKVVYLSIAELSDNASVGEATIIRFCRKLGYNGYYAFKMALAQDLPANSTDMQNNAESHINGDNVLMADIISNIFNNIDSRLKNTISLQNASDIQSAVDAILSSDSVRLYGVGSSGVVAMDAKYRFMRIGISVDSFSEGHLMSIDASLMGKRNVVIGVSHSGETKDTIEALKIAKSTGAKTIAITHHYKTHLAKSADIVLLTGSMEAPLQSGDLSTKVTQMFILEILFAEIFRRTQEKSMENKRKTSKAISEKII